MAGWGQALNFVCALSIKADVLTVRSHPLRLTPVLCGNPVSWEFAHSSLVCLTLSGEKRVKFFFGASSNI